MKKLIAIILLICIVLPLCACSRNSSKEPKEIELTLENMRDYIETSTTTNTTAHPIYASGSSTGYVCYDIDCSYKVTGSSHYRYNNVKIVVKFGYTGSGFDRYLERVDPQTCTKTVTLSFMGNGSTTCSFESELVYKTLGESLVRSRVYCSIVSISGTVTEYQP